MPSFNNLKDLQQYIENNTKKVIATENEGKIIKHNCPFCKKETEMIILKDGNVRCESCKNEIKCEWEMK